MSEKLDLNEIRKEITQLDQDLLALFAKRRALTMNVAKSKENEQKGSEETQSCYQLKFCNIE